jgi:shikimate kinase
LLEARRPLYAQADLRVAIATQQNPEEITAQILTLIPTVLKPERVMFSNSQSNN